jgi:hypothetical protein
VQRHYVAVRWGNGLKPEQRSVLNPAAGLIIASLSGFHGSAEHRRGKELFWGAIGGDNVHAVLRSGFRFADHGIRSGSFLAPWSRYRSVPFMR